MECGGRLWPWSRVGWYVGVARTHRWHSPSCPAPPSSRIVAIAFLLLVAISLPGARPADWCARHVGHPSCSPATSPWTLAIDEPFSEVIPRGSFPSAVADRWSSYPCLPDWTTLGGFYCSERVVSWHDGVMDLLLHQADGKWWMSASTPRFAGGGSYQLYGRYELRWHAEAIPGYHAVPLLWPQGEDYLALGEIDWPEGNLTGRIGGFIHHTGASSGTDQKACLTAVPFAGAWHTTVTEWTPGSVKLFLDGVLICSETQRVPSTPMRWVLQFTVSPNGLPPAGTSGHVLLDRARVWAYTP